MSRLAVCPENGLAVGAELRNVARVENRLALVFHAAARRLIKLQEAAPDRRLAAAGFAHEAERFARLDRKRNIVHRLERRRLCKSRSNREILLEVLYLDQIFMAHR